MSIKIDRESCIGCLKCKNVCPGNLIYADDHGKAYLKYESDCWGCTACVKECANGSIKYYLGADIGGNSSYLYVNKNGDELKWHLINDDNNVGITIMTNRKESNRY